MFSGSLVKYIKTESTWTFLSLIIDVLVFKRIPLLDHDRCHQGVDAGHFFPQREDWLFPQNLATEPLHPYISWWHNTLQYKVNFGIICYLEIMEPNCSIMNTKHSLIALLLQNLHNLCLLHALGSLPSWWADLSFVCGQLWVYYTSSRWPKWEIFLSPLWNLPQKPRRIHPWSKDWDPINKKKLDLWVSIFMINHIRFGLIIP